MSTNSMFASDVVYKPALVRTHYLGELVDVLRTAKGSEKRDMAEMLVVKVLEKEIDRVFGLAARKSAQLKSDLPSLATRMGHLSSPFHNSQRQMYLIRPFLESFVKDNKELTKRYGVLAGENVEAVDPTISDTDKGGAFEAYLVELKANAKVLSRQCRSNYISDILKALVKMEAEFYLLGRFIVRSSSELLDFIKLIEVLTQNSKWSSALESSCLSRLQRIRTWISESRQSFLTLISGLTPDITDFECAVCLGTMYHPVQLDTCKHRFCRECLHQHERFSAFWAYLYWIDIMCPICRGSYTGRAKMPDRAMNNLLKEYFPREYVDKSKEEFKRKMHRKFIMLIRKRIIWRDSFWES
ncbi:hypothetical protein PhCBS80983_g02686 [Powellomyces hirtus]|uniref:RING-type domain-containing protein n=1 Tax=Powellomyces hirtus TaxID=109895 RepID=A0A507E4S6_9FUNG|nr:hypothetical protein PhCBS80983_g02686 [Powellomyces hirtus]